MATQYAFGQIVTSGLAVSLDAADRNSYAGSGTIWSDLSGNNYTGNLINGPIFDPSNGGNIGFDGTNDFTAINYTGSATGNYTWEAWARAGNLAASFGALIRGRDGFGAGWSMSIGLGSAGFSSDVVTTIPSTAQITATSSVAFGAPTPVANTWYNIIGTWSAGSRLEVYVNGNLAGTRSTTSTVLRSSTTGFNLATITSTSFGSGSVAIARIYERVLSAEEILQNYNATRTRFGL